MKFGKAHNDDGWMTRHDLAQDEKRSFFFVYAWHDGSSEFRSKSSVLKRLDTVLFIKPDSERRPRLLKMKIIPYSLKLVKALVPRPDVKDGDGYWDNDSTVRLLGHRLDGLSGLNGFEFIKKYGSTKLKEQAKQYEPPRKAER